MPFGAQQNPPGRLKKKKRGHDSSGTIIQLVGSSLNTTFSGISIQLGCGKFNNASTTIIQLAVCKSNSAPGILTQPIHHVLSKHGAREIHPVPFAPMRVAVACGLLKRKKPRPHTQHTCTYAHFLFFVERMCPKRTRSLRGS